MSGCRRGLFAVLACAAACAPVVKADDELGQADFANYRFFAWLMELPLLTGDEAGPPLAIHPHASIDSGELSRVRSAIESDLTAKGYVRQDGNPDFLIVLTVGSRDIVDAPIYRGHRERWGLRSYYPDIGSTKADYADGVLSIDLVDRRLRKPVWHSWSKEPITGPAVRDGGAVITRVVSAELLDIPPRVKPLSDPQEVGFTYAEGHTSHTAESPIQLGFRAFTLYSTPCEGLPETQALVADPMLISLKVGERFFMPNVILRAFDEAGALTPDTPLIASMRYESDVLDFVSDNDRNFWVVAIGEGQGRAIFRAGCGEQGAAWPALNVEVPIVVR